MELGEGAGRNGQAPSLMEWAISLKDILETFSAAINEEQGWAVLHQTLTFYCQPRSISLPTGETLASGTSVSDASGISLICPDIASLYLDKEGFVKLVNSGGEGEECDEVQFLQHLANAICDACQFKMPDDEEAALSDEFRGLLEQLLAGPDGVSEGGFSLWTEPLNDSGEEEVTLSLLHRVLQFTKERSGEKDAAEHYQAVCRVLVVECTDFREFLQRVQAEKSLEIEGGRLCSDSEVTEDQIRFHSWAKAWMQVIRDLRAGVHLRKVSDDQGDITERSSGVYELTPYEMLMEDIRLRRFSLKNTPAVSQLVHSSPSFKMKPSLKKDLLRTPRANMDPHDRILEYIRSRPPLSPVQNRRLRPKPVDHTPKDLLLTSIRQFSVGALNKTSLPQPRDHFANYRSRLRFSAVEASPPLDLSPPSPDTMQSPPTAASTPTNQPKRKLIIPDIDTSPIDFLLENHDTSGDIEEENDADLKEYAGMSPNGHIERFGLQKKSAYPDVVSLTLDEIALIRGALAKAELENLEEQDARLFDDIRRSKVCFSCRRVKFSQFVWMFREVGVKCHLCQNTICVSCSRKMVLPCDRLDRIPVHTLSPAPDDEEISLAESAQPAISPKRPVAAASTIPRQRLLRSHTHDFTTSTLPKPQTRQRPPLQRGLTVSLSARQSPWPAPVTRRKISLPSEEPTVTIQVCVECHSVLYHAIMESQSQMASVCSSRPDSLLTSGASYHNSASSVLSDSRSDSLDEDFEDLSTDFLDEMQAHVRQSHVLNASHRGDESVSPANSRSDSTSSEAGSFYSNHI